MRLVHEAVEGGQASPIVMRISPSSASLGLEGPQVMATVPVEGSSSEGTSSEGTSPRESRPVRLPDCTLGMAWTIIAVTY